MGGVGVDFPSKFSWMTHTYQAEEANGQAAPNSWRSDSLLTLKYVVLSQMLHTVFHSAWAWDIERAKDYLCNRRKQILEKDTSLEKVLIYIFFMCLRIWGTFLVLCPR